MTRRYFLAGAALLAVGTTRDQKRLPLLPEDSRPPDFTLPDHVGRRVSLHEFLGRKRIVLAFQAPSAYLTSVAAAHAAYAERDMVVLAISPPGGPAMEAPPIYSLTDATGATLLNYDVGGSETAFYLIGKDGGIKMARHDIPSDQELFALIDAMPMRRQEMRERGK